MPKLRYAKMVYLTNIAVHIALKVLNFAKKWISFSIYYFYE